MHVAKQIRGQDLSQKTNSLRKEDSYRDTLKFKIKIHTEAKLIFYFDLKKSQRDTTY